MNPQHIIHGSPAAFAKAVNKLVSERDVALVIGKVSCSAGGVLAAVVEEQPREKNAPGALIEVSVSSVKDPAKHLAGLRAENPLWSVAAVFAVEGDGKAKAAPVIVVASLVQP